MIRFTSKLKFLRFVAPVVALPLVFWGCAQFQNSQSAAPATAPGEEVAQTENVPVVESALPAPAAGFDQAAVAKIRDEGMNRSKVMDTLSYLSDVIGPRLTGSPNLKHANEWTRDQLKGWGLQNAALEAWGPFGRGWAVKRFSAEVVAPQSITLTAYPKAWCAGLDQPLEAEVVLLDPRSVDELDSYAGKLEGKIVLIGGERPVRAHFTADGLRYTDQELDQLTRPVARGARGPASQASNGPILARGPATAPNGELLQAAPGARGARGPATSNPAALANNTARFFNFAVREKAVVICTASTIGDGGTIFVQSASVPTTNPAAVGGRGARGPSAWSNEAPTITPQLTIAVEQYNRMVRMLKAGEKVKMAVNLQVQYYTDDNMAYNTVAEIPGTDLKDELVMLGGHMDSWHSGTGATDNGAGVACAMEAVRIIKALDLHPRRTIRIALWTGEEEGLFGSAAYVGKHFGTVQAAGRGGGAGPGGGRGGRGRGATSAPSVRVVKGPEYDKLSVYFNLDNGTGKIRGVYLQGNSAVGPTFQSWLKPFADLGATTITPRNTSGTDHLSFDGIGLPGFQFIQDEIEYNARTHHSNSDVFDRIQADDMKQAATIMAAFVYNAAMTDQMVPRKPGFAPAPTTQPLSRAN